MSKIEINRKKENKACTTHNSSNSMVYYQIGAVIKQRSLQLLLDGWKVEEAANALGISTVSIARWSSTYYNVHG
jgi:hypothetical protein